MFTLALPSLFIEREPLVGVDEVGDKLLLWLLLLLPIMSCVDGELLQYLIVLIDCGDGGHAIPDDGVDMESDPIDELS